MKRLTVVVAVLVAVVLYLYSQHTGDNAESETDPLLRHTLEPGAEQDSDWRARQSESEDETGLPPGDADNGHPGLPSLTASDEAVRQALESLVGADALADWLRPAAIIERTVATIDSLDGAPLPLRFRPLRHVPGLPAVIAGPGGGFALLAPENARRYVPLVRLMEAAEPADAAALFQEYYPLLQEAYRSLGASEDGEFDLRVIEVIDHLLATPQPPSSIELVRPEVFYEFADPRLEGLSFGRKILIRVGPEHAQSIKSWLRQFRAEISQNAAAEEIRDLPGESEI